MQEDDDGERREFVVAAVCLIICQRSALRLSRFLAKGDVDHQLKPWDSGARLFQSGDWP